MRSEREVSMRRVAPLAALAVLAVLIGGPLSAQTISLSPPVVQLKGTLGQSSTQTLTLTNMMKVPLTFDLVAQDVVVREGARVFVDAGAEADSMAATAVFTPSSVTVPAGGSKSVDVTITARPPAAHRAVVALFRGRTRIANGRTGTIASLGALLTFTLSDDVEIAADELAVQPPSASTLLEFTDSLTNTGAEPVVVKGVAAILDAGGRLVGRAAFESRRLLPLERGVMHAAYPGALAAGTYRALATFDYEGRALTKSAQFVVP
jgi:Fn3 domain-containing protein